MRIALLTPVSLALLGVLTLGVACSDDEPVDDPGKGGSGGKGGTSSTAGKGGNKVGDGGGDTAGGVGGAGGGAGGGGALDVCAELGGPANIDAVVRGDGKVAAADPFNVFKFEKGGRKNSVVLNAATDPCISQQFAQLLLGTAAANAQLEHFAQCLSLFMQATAGCEGVVYDGSTDSEGELCKSMLDAHTGLGITEEDYMALIISAGAALSDAGVLPTSPAFLAVAGALTDPALKAEIIESTETVYSNPGPTCDAPAAGGAGGGGGAGGAP